MLRYKNIFSNKHRTDRDNVMMTNNAVAKNPNTSDPSPDFAGFAAASVIAVLLAGIFAFLSLASNAETDFALDSKINPNIASAGLLMQLPKIGPKKAQTIVDYRQQAKAQPAFGNIEDLQKVKGIGPKTAENIHKWLVFE